MPLFNVTVHSTTPKQTHEALTVAGIETRGPSYSKYMEAEGSAVVTPDMKAQVQAETAEAAVERVREVVGADCAVGPADPLD